jgi:outer membrane protein assembly factor BamB
MQAPTLTPTWVKRIKGGGFLGAHEYGRCVVISEKGAIHVVMPSGETAWSWPYRKVSRFFSARVAAVAPDCDAVAIPGSSTYKFTWIVERTGRSVAVQTAGTPLDVAFDRTGQVIAIGTGGATPLLYTRNGEQRWSRDFDSERVPLSDDVNVLAKSSDGRVWLESATALDCLDEGGAVLASIALPPFDYIWKRILISRNFEQLVAAYQEPGEIWRVESYSVPKPCAR